jgi:hypothetical protein
MATLKSALKDGFAAMNKLKDNELQQENGNATYIKWEEVKPGDYTYFFEGCAERNIKGTDTMCALLQNEKGEKFLTAAVQVVQSLEGKEQCMVRLKHTGKKQETANGSFFLIEVRTFPIGK